MRRSMQQSAPRALIERVCLRTSVSKLKLRSGEDAQVVYRDKKQDGLLLQLNVLQEKGLARPVLRPRATQDADGGVRGVRSARSRPHVCQGRSRTALAHSRANRKTILSDRVKTALANRDSFKAVSDWYVEKFVDGQRRSAPQIKAIIKAVLPAWRTRRSKRSPGPMSWNSSTRSRRPGAQGSRRHLGRAPSNDEQTRRPIQDRILVRDC